MIENIDPAELPAVANYYEKWKPDYWIVIPIILIFMLWKW